MYAIRPARAVRKKGQIGQDNARMLGNVSLRFEQSMSAVPVLAIYETQPTKIRYTLFSNEKLIVSSLELTSLSFFHTKNSHLLFQKKLL